MLLAEPNSDAHAGVSFLSPLALARSSRQRVLVNLDAQIDTNEPRAPSQVAQPFTENSPFYRYFFGSPKQQPPARQIKTVLGSGFLISSDGYAVTKDHVVQHGVSFQIQGQEFRTRRQ